MKPLRIGLLNIEPVLQSELPVLLVFGAVWDMNSRKLFGNLNLMAEKYDGKIITGKVDYDYAPDIFSDYEISQIPTMIFFEAGKPIMRKTGYNGSFDIERFIYKFYGVMPDF